MVEDFGHQAQAPVLAHAAAVAGDDAAGLLAPVLQGVEAEIGEPGRVRVAVDAEDAAVLPGLVVDDRVFRFPFSVFGGFHRPILRVTKVPEPEESLFRKSPG